MTTNGYVKWPVLIGSTLTLVALLLMIFSFGLGQNGKAIASVSLNVNAHIYENKKAIDLNRENIVALLKENYFAHQTIIKDMGDINSDIREIKVLITTRK